MDCLAIPYIRITVNMAIIGILRIKNNPQMGDYFLVADWQFALIGREGLRVASRLLIGPKVGLRANIEDFGRSRYDTFVVIIVIMDGPDCAIATATIGTIKVQVSSNNRAIEGKLLITVIGTYAIILVSRRDITSFNSISDYPTIVVCYTLIKYHFVCDNNLLRHLMHRLVNLIMIEAGAVI